MSELSASILLTLRDEVSERTKAIVARIAELEQQVKQGGDVGAAAALELRNEFEALTASTRESEQISRRFAQAQRVLGAANEGAAAATGSTTRAQQQAGSAISFVSKESKNQGREIGGLVNVFAELGYSVGSAIPGMQQTGTQLAIMGGTAYQLGAAFGVAGAAVGVLSGLLPTLISAFSGASRESRNLKQGIDETIESYESLMSQIRRRQQYEAEQRDLAAGNADVESQRANVEVARVNQANLQRDINARAARVPLSPGLTTAQMTYIRNAVGDSPSASPQSIAEGACDMLRARVEATLSDRERGLGGEQRSALVAERVQRLESLVSAGAATIQSDPEIRKLTHLLSVANQDVAVAQRGLETATAREAELSRRANASERVDLVLRDAGAEHTTAERALLDQAESVRGRRLRGRLERDIRDGSLSEGDARRFLGGDQGEQLLATLRAATEEQTRLQGERDRLDAEERQRRLQELDALERAGQAMERAADAMERGGAKPTVSGRGVYGQGAELGGAS